MKGVEIFKGNWTLQDVKNDESKLFIFGDNNARIGKGGQAIIRDCINSIGLRTKKGPNNKSVAFYSDSEFESNCKKIFDDVIHIKSNLVNGTNIVFSNGGYGTGLANLKEKAPLTFKYLCDILRSYFEFDNESGKKWTKIPSYNDIVGGIYLDIDKSNSDLLMPVNNTFFKDELLTGGLTSYYDLIRYEKKVSFTSKVSYSKDQILLLSFLNKKEYLVVRVCSDSYDVNSIHPNNWSIFEGVNFDYINSIKNINDYKQTNFQFICSLNEGGEMIFKDDIFKNIDIDKKKDFKIVGDPFLVDNDKLDNDSNEISVDLKSDVEEEDVIIDLKSALEEDKDVNEVRIKIIKDDVVDLKSVVEDDKDDTPKNKYTTIKNKLEDESTETPIKKYENVMDNSEVLKKLDDILKKLDILNKKPLFRNPFKKTLEEHLTERGLIGEITKIPVLYTDIHLGYLPKYQVKVDDIYYAIGLNDWFLFTTIDIILVSKTPFV